MPGIWSPAFGEHDEVSAALVADSERNLYDRVICPGVTPQRRCEHPAIDL